MDLVRYTFAALRRPKNCALVGAISFITWAAPAHAEQFILFEATFDYSWDDAINSSPSQSHYYVNEGNWLNTERPGDWVSPVNYRDGSVHIRVEVLEKPAGDQQVGWALCYIANVGSYGCPYTDYYTSEGVFETDVSMDSFWTSGPITWESGIRQVDLVYTINNSGSGHVHNYPNLKDATTPTSVRITMVQVSQGDTYDPSILEEPGGTGGTGSGGSDAGAGGTGSVPGTGAPGTGGVASAGTGGTDSGITPTPGTDVPTTPEDTDGGDLGSVDELLAEGEESKSGDDSGETGGCAAASIAAAPAPQTPFLWFAAAFLGWGAWRRRARCRSHPSEN